MESAEARPAGADAEVLRLAGVADEGHHLLLHVPGVQSLPPPLLGHGQAGQLAAHQVEGRVERNSMRTEMPTTITMRGREGGPSTIQNNTTTTMTMERVEK